MEWKPTILTALFVCLPLFSLSSLAQTSPVPAQTPPLPGAAYGAYPHNYQEIITAWLNSALVDPNGVRIKWRGEPRPGELSVGKGQIVSGFLVDFSVNARNIFGAFTGDQKHTALIRDGQVVTATGFVVR
jgi:hypothetical protein